MYKDIGCGEVREKDEGKILLFGGWVHKRRDHGSLVFIDLIASKGNIQIVSALANHIMSNATPDQFKST